MPRLSKIGAAALAAFGWTSGGGASVVTATYLQVAGGGGGGSDNAGGGAGGGFLTGTTSLNPTLSYAVIVGAGGAAPTGVGTNGSQGGNSQFGALTASVGGGYGAKYQANGGNGGSGGGSGGWYSSATTAGTATSGQGYNGGAGDYSSVGGGGGGGGGAGAIGSNGSGNNGGTGGNGASSSITGSSVTYAGGGGGGTGGASGYTGGTGGTGGGGTGCSNQNNNATAGTANLGGGGGGGGYGNGANLGRQGGSGVVIISYAGAQQFGGGIVTSVGGNTIHTFNTSGTLTPLNSLTASYLIVAGGGGGAVGGGGAGGLLSGSGTTIDTNSTYLVTVGAGGAGATTDGQGTSGANSSFAVVSTAAVGGGGAGGYGASSAVWNGLSGGSGGGGGARSGAGQGTGGSATSGQGYSGGSGFNNGVGGSPGGGGGGAGAAGGNASGTSVGGNGGVGVASTISGTSKYYAGGGGGCAYSGTQGTGGNGGGGSGVQSGTPNSGTANTGGGGGGNFNVPPDSGGAGGSGIVIISYAGTTQQMAGGTVTITGGNVIHTFTSSGYLTPLTYVGNSLRFRSSNSAYLSRTPTVTSNQTTWTWSAWVKRGQFGAYQGLFNSFTDTSNYSVLDFTSSDQIRIINNYAGGGEQGIITNAVYRDPAAWYHIVVACSASSVPKLYVNGVQVTSFASSSAVTGNWLYNTAGKLIKIGYENYTGSYNFYFDGYMANVQFIDGQALAPTAFGTFNSYGVWQPINYGGSYGTNGFYLPMTATQSYAGSFNGSSQYLTAAYNSAFDLPGDFTIECWAYVTNVSPGYNPTLIARWGGSGGQVYTFQILAGGTFRFITAGGTWTGGTVSANNWYHLAVSRTGSSLKMFINGVLQSTNTDSTNLTGTQIQSIGGENNGAQYTPGYISNVRIVKGTGLYTNSFTPSTTPLTNVSGTSLLTLQNATIVDNSSNAFSITNNGSVSTAATYPFAILANTVTDFGPAGNNWTANNIGQTTGYTLDTMTDVPTLTSTTQANYAVLNPLDIPSSSTSYNGNLTFNSSANATWKSICSTMAMNGTGKFYAEFTFQSGSNAMYGIVGSTFNANVADSRFWIFTPSYAYYNSSGLYYNNTNSAYGTSYTVNDVIGVAFDAGAGTITFYKNGTSQGVAATGITGSFFFAGGAYNSSGGEGFSVNFGQQPWAYTPPAGYVGLNTYNL